MSSTSTPPRRPAPTRTLRQPQSLNVKEHPSSSPTSSARSTSDEASLRQSLEDRAAVQKATLIAMESLLEDTPVDRQAFKQALTYLTPSAYLSILHERHLSRLCSHPLCPNPPKKPFTSFSSPRSRILRDGGEKRIVQVTGNEEDGFCSKECWRRSEWVRRSGMLGEEGRWLRGEGGASGAGVTKGELLEEVEERLERDKATKAEEDASSAAGEPPVPAPPLPPAQATLATTASNPSSTPLTAATVQPAEPPTGAAALIASLRIIERPTLPSSTPPAPPSLNPTPSSSSPSKYIGTTSSRAAALAPPAHSNKTELRLKEERRRADASASSMIPGSVGRMGDVLVGAHAQAGGRKGDAAKAARGVVGEGEGGRRKSGGGAVAGTKTMDGGEAEREGTVEKDEEVVEEEDDENLDGLGDIWAEMYVAREEAELAEEEEGRG